MLKQHYRDVCDANFPLTVRATAPSRSRNNIAVSERLMMRKQQQKTQQHRSRVIRRRTLHTLDIAQHAQSIISENNRSTLSQRRGLRLKEQHDPTRILEFKPEMVSRSVRQRIKQFQELYNHRSIPASLRTQLDDIDLLMQPFGYSLRAGVYDLFKRQQSLLDPWDLVRRWRKTASASVSVNSKVV